MALPPSTPAGHNLHDHLQPRWQTCEALNLQSALSDMLGAHHCLQVLFTAPPVAQMGSIREARGLV